MQQLRDTLRVRPVDLYITAKCFCLCHKRENVTTPSLCSWYDQILQGNSKDAL